MPSHSLPPDQTNWCYGPMTATGTTRLTLDELMLIQRNNNNDDLNRYAISWPAGWTQGRLMLPTLPTPPRRTSPR